MENNIGNVINQYRQASKMTQEEFALRLGVTAQAVSKWERNQGMPDVSLLAGICRILGITAGTLLGVGEKVEEGGNGTVEKEIRNNMIAEPFVLEFGTDLLPYVIEGLKTDYVNRKRIELVKKTGKLMPVLRIRDNAELEKNEYRLLVFDKQMFCTTLGALEQNPYKKVIDDVVEACDKNYAMILNKNLVKIMIDNVAEQFPGVVEDLIPSRISVFQVEQELKQLVKEGKSIRDMIGILEAMEMKLENK